jgi:alkylhydroperoxidase family enzyme
MRAIIERQLRKEERLLGTGSLDYVRHILRTARGAFFRFMGVMPLAQYRRSLPPDAYHVARLVATQHEDCGTCVQIEVRLARKSGVSAEIVRAAIERKPETLPERLAAVYRFAEAVVAATYAEGDLRERIRKEYGERGLVEMALGMASCRVFPVTKRALGFAVSCSKVKIEIEQE